ncbi:MAG TPA: hypothetical protein VKA40_03380 [Nitrososphaera sp.]|nr:hypothetical protein [Nitrososphaera sp.]
MLSLFSELDDGLNNDPRHPLVQHVKNNCGFQDDNQEGYVYATCYRADKRETQTMTRKE